MLKYGKCEICKLEPAVHSAVASTLVPSSRAACMLCLNNKAEMWCDLYWALDRRPIEEASKHLRSCTMFKNGKYLTFDEYVPLYREAREL